MGTLNVWSDETDSKHLLLNRETSIILPTFDTTSIIHGGISKIVLSLYLKKIDKNESNIHVTINPVDEKGHTIDDGLSTHLEPKVGRYINLDLPVSLFKKAVGSRTRFLLKLVGPDVSMEFDGPDRKGTTNDPKLQVVYVSETSVTRSHNIYSPIINNYFANIENSQVNLGNGDFTQNNYHPDNNFINGLFWKLIIPILVIVIAAYILSKT